MSEEIRFTMKRYKNDDDRPCFKRGEQVEVT